MGAQKEIEIKPFLEPAQVVSEELQKRAIGEKKAVVPVKVETRKVHEQHLGRELDLMMSRVAGMLVSKAEQHMREIKKDDLIISQMTYVVRDLKKEQGIA